MMQERKTYPYDVLVVGELNIDLILNRIAGFPEMSKEILAEEMTVTLGSSSAIFANNLSVLGSRVSYLGKVGDDQFADLVCKSLEKSGVDIGNIIRTAAYQTGLTVALNYDNDRAMVTYPGAMNDLKIGDLTEKVLGIAPHLHLSSVFLQEGIKPEIVGVFEKAKRMGMTTSLDPQWDPREKWDLDLNALLPLVDIFLPNEEELRQFTGMSDINAAIEKIKPACNIVVVKQGVKGATMWDKHQLVHQKAFLNDAVVDAIGAGDSFNSGFIHKFTSGADLNECLRFAAITGAVNTTAAGGTAAFGSREQILATAREKFRYQE
jgi:sugar/nucleoside kinase (ribokinase family)